MPKPVTSDEAGFHGGKRAAKADHQGVSRSKSPNDAGADNEAADYVHITIKKGGEKFWIMAHKTRAERLKAGEDIMLSDVVENSDVYFGKQGEPNRASRAMLRSVYS
eukprot:TRINITY_DN6083_c0_g1_i2.p1 TRINITY_DN6083_c0_g1~~TRINITY_DN6083_c0_g1_i2.p1  ORF type:complete len:125 (-),score=12.96 TRINITY_DN6083_c0_g1_i2:3060-3380(-)